MVNSRIKYNKAKKKGCCLDILRISLIVLGVFSSIFSGIIIFYSNKIYVDTDISIIIA
jgi:hypothetical protein